jgi:hypothetical protein
MEAAMLLSSLAASSPVSSSSWVLVCYPSPISRPPFQDAYTSATALPIVLAHTGQINVPAAAMSIAGGLLIYTTIISFSLSFREDEEF